MTENRRLNVVVLGEMGVGKSSLLVRFAKRIYNPHTPTTVVADVLQAKINIDKRLVDLILWDTAGQEQFRAIVRNYFRKADGVLLVYDVTRLASFTELPKWLSDLRNENDTAPVIIVGTKIDKADSKEKVSVERVKEFANRHKLDFMEASSKSGENVDKIFEKLTRKMLKSIASAKSETASSEVDTFVNGTVHSSRSVHEDDARITLHETKPLEKPKKRRC
ncbi:ras-related protein Rab-18-B-like [Argiope bruennichi]|uniref:Ras-related protein Rab-14 like protein n=1 Tax=Argiope bruennichi TaxID=94029 RepID=A0A8T0E9E6_ARGBR|nr:ras-related protein Rab-18-B-like [Argiope bruennichi]KAF8767950.1 Ras-related protein Rab-14 like protein [Argiope bruennichi]